MSGFNDDAAEETAQFSKVIATFKHYQAYSLSANNRRRKDFFRLPPNDREILSTLGYKEKLAAVDKAIITNAEFFNQIVADPHIFGHEVEEEPPQDGIYQPEMASLPSGSHFTPPLHDYAASQVQSYPYGGVQPTHQHSHAGPSHSHDTRPTDFDMDKLRSTLKQFVRDWSDEGKVEREACYEPMKAALCFYFKDIPPEQRGSIRVLVPGSGLGRLAWDVAALGFSCQGNEFSHYMLLASFFMLNRTSQANQHKIFPYVHTFSNLPKKDAMLRAIYVPDVSPTSLPATSEFSLVAGDFEEIYGGQPQEGEPQSGQWNAIMTCFFIDTAKNVVNYLRIIHRILAPGGIWINLGPLLWHWENNSSNDVSIELDLQEIKALAANIGFEFMREGTIDTTYTNNAESMLGYVYHAAFWTAKKAG